jgi:hypothetical protein
MTLVLPVIFPTSFTGDPVTALSAADVANKLGVQVHMAFYTTTYNDVTQVIALLEDLGVNHVRDTYNVGFPTQHTRQLQVANNAGVKFTMTARLSDTVAGFVDGLVTDGLAPVLQAIEGINEPDNAGGSWAANTRTHHQALYPAAKAKAGLSALPVIAPSLANTITNAAALGDLSAYCDRANAHVYSGNPPTGVGSYTLANSIAVARTIAGAARPVVITEQGYHNAPASGSSIKYVDETTAGVYAPRILLENVLAGTERVFIYELIDQTTETPGTDAQQHYGLCRADYTKKPAFTAVKNLLALLNDPGPAYTPAPLPLTVAPPIGDTTTRSLLVGKRDGSYELLLWRDVSVWNPTTATPITVTPISVTVAHPSGSTTVSLAGDLAHVTIPAGG